MSRFATALFTCLTAAALAGGPALTPTIAMAAPGKAAPVAKADRAALKTAIVACKARAKGEKVKWLARRKYVNNCVTEKLKDRPHIDVMDVLKNHPDMKDLPMEKYDAS
ncbi:hypothetical protein V1294_000538 [Bradyrhizobium sp. AZCC 1678]|uniref:hypothetical protein n=1 Tax=Bradyrhizobium sp. AZCC 1678 TaxID=3117030 RepID=UPI002FF10420